MKAVRLGKVVAAVAVMLAVAPAMADMVSVQTNLVDGVQDAFFSGGVLTIAEGPLDGVVTTEDSTGTYPQPWPASDPPYTNSNFSLSSTFNSVVSVGGVPYAKFVGGSVSLTFDLGASSYELSGPISVILAKVVSASPSLSTIQAEGLFTAATANLPELWNAPGFSSLDSLIFDIGEDLSAFDWYNDDWNGMAEATVQMVPNDNAIPEPASMALLALGGLALLRRR